MPYIESEMKAKIREIRNNAEPVLNGFTDKLELYEIKPEHFQWLIEKAEKYQKIHDSWMDNSFAKNYQVVQFLRECKEVIEGVEIPKRNRMS